MPEGLIYLDNLATTRTDHRVLAAMLPYFGERYGNPASATHPLGWEAFDAVEQARAEVAGLIGATSQDIVFTSGATEANNLALRGVALSRRRGHLITSATEHASVLAPCYQLKRQGFRVTVLPVDRYGRVDVARLTAELTEATILVSVMVANNEIGTLQPVREVGRVCRERGVLFHTDAAQAVGKVPLNVDELGIDLLSLSAHKAYGPKGIGALYVRSNSRAASLTPLLEGGGQERGLRAGTVAVPLVVGFGRAAALCRAEMATDNERILRLRERLQARLSSELPEAQWNGHAKERLPGSLHFSLPGLDAGVVLGGLRGVALSAGSACTSALGHESHVLRAIGLSRSSVRGSLRFGLGRFTNQEDVDGAAAELLRVIRTLRSR